MTELQTKLLEMMKWLHQYIIGHGLCYYIYGGTMLGAARHQGFIPWDDDIDIVMPRKDYEKLCKLLEKPVEHYVLECTTSPANDFLYTYGKFYDTNTKMTELCNIPVKRGVYIDIFPLDGLGNTEKEAEKNFRKIKRRNIVLMTRVCTYNSEKNFLRNMAIFLGRLVPSCIINNKKLAMNIDYLSKQRDLDDDQFIGVTSEISFKFIINKNLLGTPKEFPFENIVLNGFEKYDEILTTLYGDWRQLPPEEKRVPHHDFVDMDLNHSFYTD